LLGVRTLEGFGVMVDNIGHRFVATTTIVASADTPASSLFGVHLGDGTNISKRSSTDSGLG